MSPEKNSDRILVKSAGPVGAATLLSRVLGLVREQTFAYLFGATDHNDAFVAAFRIPNFLRDMFAEGALSAAFVPVFTETLSKDGKDPAWELANRVLAVLSGAVTAATGLGIALSPWLVPVITQGYSGPKLALTIQLTQIMFPYLICVSLAALLMGMLNATNRFFVPALASSVLNIAMIAAGFVLTPLFDPPILAMAVGVLIGGVCQVLMQAPSLIRQGWRPRWRLDLSHPKLRKILRLAAPVTLGYSATQINVFVNTYLASFAGAGALSYLNYSYRLMHLPLGVFSVSLATVILPTLSRQAAEKKIAELKDTLAFGLRMVFYLTLPAMTGLLILAGPLCRLLYQHGVFTADDTAGTALALQCYSLGLIGYSGARILAPAYFSLQDTKTPFTITGIVVLLNITIAVSLFPILDYAGIALATSLSGIANLFLLMILLRRKVGLIRGRSIAAALAKVGFACVLMGLVSWGLNLWLEGTIGITLLWQRILTLSISGGIGLLVYVLVTSLLRVEEGALLIRMIKGRLFGRK